MVKLITSITIFFVVNLVTKFANTINVTKVTNVTEYTNVAS